MKSKLIDLSVLFVEDDRELNELITSKLQRYFKTVYSCYDGQQAFETYKNKNPQILFVDINLPKLDGLELVKKIRQNDQSTKIVMITARSDVDTILAASSLKLTKYLVKPLNRKELDDTVAQLLHEINSFKTINLHRVNLGDNYVWDIHNSSLKHLQSEVSLTPMQNKVLKYFIENKSRTITFDEILINVWDDFEVDKTESLKTIVKTLRKKIPKNLISSIYGVGYKVNF